MRYAIVYSPHARQHLDAIYDYVADQAGADIARNYTRQLEDACQRLEHFPCRGTPRDDIRVGLRTVSVKRRAVIVFSVEDEVVVIHGVFYAGQDIDAAFDEDEPQHLAIEP